MHGINSNKNNSRIINHKTGLMRGCKICPRGNCCCRQTFWPVYSFRSAKKYWIHVEKHIIRVRHMALLLYIPNFGLRSHPTSEFGFSTSHMDGRNLFLGYHHHNTIAGCDDVLTPRCQKQLFWQEWSAPGCCVQSCFPSSMKKKTSQWEKNSKIN